MARFSQKSQCLKKGRITSVPGSQGLEISKAPMHGYQIWTYVKSWNLFFLILKFVSFELPAWSSTLEWLKEAKARFFNIFNRKYNIDQDRNCDLFATCLIISLGGQKLAHVYLYSTIHFVLSYSSKTCINIIKLSFTWTLLNIFLHFHSFVYITRYPDPYTLVLILFYRHMYFKNRKWNSINISHCHTFWCFRLITFCNTKIVLASVIIL